VVSLSAGACQTWLSVIHQFDFDSSACYGVLRFVMESGAKGCEVVVSGKLRAARAKSMKFTDGFMIHSGQPARDFVDYAVRHVLLRQGVLGIKVKMYASYSGGCVQIMLTC
jgi:ribosomal protein S3